MVEEEKMAKVSNEKQIERVSELTYLGSLIADNSRIHAEVEKRIANASIAFETLRSEVLKDIYLLLFTEMNVYGACVM